APLGQDGGQSGSVVVVSRRAADQDVAADAGLQRRLSRAADQDVAALSADEPIRASASDENIVGHAARDIQNVVAVAREKQNWEVDVVQLAARGLRCGLDDVVARLAIDDDVADVEEAAVVDEIHTHLDAVVDDDP